MCKEPSCGKVFKHPSVLKEHMLTHKTKDLLQVKITFSEEWLWSGISVVFSTSKVYLPADAATSSLKKYVYRFQDLPSLVMKPLNQSVGF